MILSFASLRFQEMAQISLLHNLKIMALFCVLLRVSSLREFSDESDAFRGDYTPPSPPPPYPPPHPPSLACDDGLAGTGSLNTLCELNSSLNFVEDVYIEGNGSLNLLPGVTLACPSFGCSILINISGDFSLGFNSSIIAGSVRVAARTADLSGCSLINVTGLAGEPPAETSGTPSGLQGGGGGHGGRGASCVTDNTKFPDDVWGGDAYSWSTLDKPASYGSRGGTTSKEVDYGGEGGGAIWLEVSETADVHGNLLADGGYGGVKGGGGSGGSIYIKAHRMIGRGKISVAGGNGFAGGGGGRVSINVFSRHDDLHFLMHGGSSFGCSENSGAAGTYYDSVPRILIVSNHNMSTLTDTLLLDFPKQPLWTNVYIKDHAKALVPLFWSRVQVQGQIRLSCAATLIFGLAHFASSEFELMAEELLMSDSVVKIFGALRMSVKIYLMLNSKMIVDGGNDAIVATSLLEASNLVVLKESSAIHSNANLGIHGQGSLNMSGPGNMIEAQHLVLSLFFSINVDPGSFLRGPLENANGNCMAPKLYCDLPDCPFELLHPPEDCNVNSTLAFTVQICRVEDVVVEGTILGSVIHFHLVRSIVIPRTGVISASGLGCSSGVGRGQVFENGLSGGGGHGGRGGDGYYGGDFIEGGVAYGDAGLPCELGSGSGNDSLAGTTSGGGIIVMGSLEHSLSTLSLDGALKADGESFGEDLAKKKGYFDSRIGPGGGSGGTILIFVNALALGNSSTISTVGGRGSPYGGGGGGGGRVHFHWSEIPIGDAYIPVSTVNGTILTGGGPGKGHGRSGQNGTVSGKPCPKGLYGIFCEECPVGTFKNVTGSHRALCYGCPSPELPLRAVYVSVRGGVTETPCPYKCISDRYRMPNCQTALEELLYTFGGPWLFGLLLLSILILLALVLSVARMKYVSVDDVPALAPARHGSQIDHSFPFLESLNEVLETNRNEESQNHVHRMYFMGPNTFSEPWYLPHSPPLQLKDIVYEDAFNRFVDEINDLAVYRWWEGSVYSLLSVLAYPLSWLWLQRCRKNKMQKLREYVRSEYDHSCLRSCRSRALYEGIKVAASSDFMLAYVDFFLGGDENRAFLPPHLHQRSPMSLLFGGDGSYMAPFSLHNDNIITSLISQSVPPTIWYRIVAGLNAQLRLVRRGHLKVTFGHLINWIGTHANPTLEMHSTRIDLAWFQPTASGYRQFGIVISAAENQSGVRPLESRDISSESQSQTTHRGFFGGILDAKSIRTLKDKSFCYPFSFILYNTKPIGRQDLVGLVISILILGDFSLVSLSLLQQYSISLLNFLLVLLILPFGLLFPFPAGISALFSQGPRRSAGLARVYALWNITSLINVVVAFICGYVHYKSHPSKKRPGFQSWNFSMDESEWWVLPWALAACKTVQTRMMDRHAANQEIQDHSLYANDPHVFWQS